MTITAQERRVAEKENALGAQLANGVRQKTTAVDSAALRDYVERIGRQLAAQLPDSGLTYRFTVIADDVGGRTHEPLSFPGGYVFVPANLILTARNEAEFAGMLAHAMAHIAELLPHRTQIANLASIPLIFMDGWTGLGAGSDYTLVPVGFRSSQRRFETQADALAIKMMAGAGYDPVALVRYIGRARDDSRIINMESAIQDLPPRPYTDNSPDEFPGFQDELRPLLPKPRPPSLMRPNENPPLQ